MQLTDLNIVLIGGAGGTNVASGYSNACQSLDISSQLIDYSRLLRWPLAWRIWRKATRAAQSPWLIPSAGEIIRKAGRSDRQNVLFVCGLWPLPGDALRAAQHHGWHTGIYLTDSPWNSSLPYSVNPEQLSSYGRIFSPRRSDIVKLRQGGMNRCEYLPFSYDRGQFYPDVESRSQDDIDVLFVGGGDRSRLPILEEILKLPVRTRIIGNYWPKLLHGHRAATGQQSHSVVREATSAARVNLCLVRRANFDGHVMRSIEIGACGGCILAERTDEHLEILGAEGESAMYFSDSDEMIQKIRVLLEHPEQRLALAKALHERISGPYTYEASLKTVLAAFAAA